MNLDEMRRLASDAMHEQNQERRSGETSRFEWKVVGVTAAGFAGLCGLGLLRWRAGITGTELIALPMGAIATSVFAGMFVVGLLVLWPLAILARQRRKPPPRGRPITWWGILLLPLLLPLEMVDPDWTMPRWISWPIVAVLYGLVFLLVVMLVVFFVLYP